MIIDRDNIKPGMYLDSYYINDDNTKIQLSLDYIHKIEDDHITFEQIETMSPLNSCKTPVTIFIDTYFNKKLIYKLNKAYNTPLYKVMHNHKGS